MNLSPQQMSAMQSRYTGVQPDAPALMGDDVPVPQDDDAAVALVKQSKAAIDGNGGIQNLSPAMKKHVGAVVQALEQYYQANQDSPIAKSLMSAIRSDPALAPYL